MSTLPSSLLRGLGHSSHKLRRQTVQAETLTLRLQRLTHVASCRCLGAGSCCQPLCAQGAAYLGSLLHAFGHGCRCQVLLGSLLGSQPLGLPGLLEAVQPRLHYLWCSVTTVRCSMSKAVPCDHAAQGCSATVPAAAVVKTAFSLARCLPSIQGTRTAHTGAYKTFWRPCVAFPDMLGAADQHQQPQCAVRRC